MLMFLSASKANCNFVRHFPLSACIHPRLPLAGLSHPVHQFRVSSESSQSNREIDMFLEIYGNLMFHPPPPPMALLTTTRLFPTKKIFSWKKRPPSRCTKMGNTEHEIRAEKRNLSGCRGAAGDQAAEAVKGSCLTRSWLCQTNNPLTIWLWWNSTWWLNHPSEK